MKNITPILLAILDGWGAGPLTESNAIYVAKTPNMDRWQATYPYTTLLAHNGAVGLPEGQMGNSEVGHLNIGAGRIVYQDFTRINHAKHGRGCGGIDLQYAHHPGSKIPGALICEHGPAASVVTPVNDGRQPTR